MVKVTFAGGRVCPSASLQVIQPHLHAVIDDRYHTGYRDRYRCRCRFRVVVQPDVHPLRSAEADIGTYGGSM